MKREDDMRSISVAFIVQMPEIWDKQADVYERMCSADDFDPYLISVPKYNIKTGQPEQCYGIEDEYFTRKYPNARILRLNQFGSFLFEKYNFDYVFYQRPYDHMLPACLQSSYVSSKTNVCYIPYATNEQKSIDILPSGFFNNVHFAFMAETESVQILNEKLADCNNTHKRNICCVGYPMYEHVLAEQSYDNSYSSILWAPRWSYDSTFGGSHFFEYINLFESYRPKVNNIIVRPHPSMWGNFQKTNLCSKEDIEIIHDRWKSIGIEEDVNASILNAFERSDILVSDPSSIIAIYFLTGKPVIFCPKEPYHKSDLTEFINRILPGLYIARSDCELKSLLDMLSQEKKDPLKQTRDKMINEYFSYNYGATEKILSILRDCFNC